MQPLETARGGYLPGYLAMRNLWNRAYERSPRLHDPDLFLSFLYSVFLAIIAFWRFSWTTPSGARKSGLGRSSGGSKAVLVCSKQETWITGRPSTKTPWHQGEPSTVTTHVFPSTSDSSRVTFVRSTTGILSKPSVAARFPESRESAAEPELHSAD